MTMNYILAKQGEWMNSYLELGDVLNPDIISDCSHDNSGFALTARHLHLTDLSAKEAKSAIYHAWSHLNY